MAAQNMRPNTQVLLVIRLLNASDQ